MATVKFTHLNAYKDAKDREYVVIELENGDKLFINKAIIKYAFDHVRDVKPKTKDAE